MDQFTTDSISANEGLDAWQAAVQESCVPLTVCATGPHRFEAEISSCNIGDLYLSVVSSVDHTCSHDRSHIASMDGEYLMVSIQLAGEGRLDQSGQSAYVAGGEMVFYNSAQPFHWHFPGASRQLVVCIPYAHLRFRIPQQHIALAQTIPCASGMAKIAADYMMSLFNEAENLEPGLVHALAGSAVDVIAGTLTACGPAKAGPHTRLQALQINQANAFIQKHIRDPELSPVMIATALGISVRYLHYLFNAHGVSVSRSILQLRLAGCAEALARRSNDMESISTIAYAWGFNSAVHFCRVFRSAYGMSASDYRALHVGCKVSLACAA